MLLAVLSVQGCRSIPEEAVHRPALTSIRDFFSLESDDIIISGHRGGFMDGFPENCLESFITISGRMPVYFEVDPRFTKDSVVVLLHDDEVSRSTDGTGLLSGLDYNQLSGLRLKDRSGKLTRFHVPTLESVLEWSKDKVILNLDRKDVPVENLIDIMEKHGANNCIFTVHNAAQAAEILKCKGDALFSAFIGTEELFDDYQEQGLLEHIVVAYVQAASLQDDMAQLYSKIRSHGIRCMVSIVNEQDLFQSAKRREYYQYLVDMHPDVIETDRPLEFIGLKNVRTYER